MPVKKKSLDTGQKAYEGMEACLQRAKPLGS